MPRSIDHLVLASRDLDAQAAFYERLGFIVGSRNKHPWGTRNHIIQFAGSFLELISMGPDFHAPVDPDPHLFSFPVFVHDYLNRREGFAMLALASSDAEADHRTFKAAGIGDFDTFHFERHGKKPDGSPTTVGFTLAYAHSRLMPLAGFFACQHHFPQNFWNPAFQQHRNGAMRVARVVMVAENPADHAEFLQHLTGQRELLATSMGYELALENNAVIEVLTPIAAAFRYGAAAQDSTPDAHLAIAVIETQNLKAVRACCEAGGIAHEITKDALRVAPAEAMGVGLVFNRAR